METVTATPNDTEGEKTVDLEWNVENFLEIAKIGDASYSITATLKDGYHFDDVDKTNEISVEVLVVDPDNAKLLEALEQHVTTEKVVDHIGTKINLFDYWSGETRFEGDFLHAIDTEDGRKYRNNGVNKDKYLKFAYGYSVDAGKNNINAWTGENGAPRYEIVENMLPDKTSVDELSGNIISKGFPVIKENSYYGIVNDSSVTKKQSLDYLFKLEDTDFKKSFEDVKGLLQVDQKGYYYYNAKKDATNFEGENFESANYAYFDEPSNSFVLYDTWGAKRGNIEGQFFPFTSPETAFKLTGQQTDDGRAEITQTNTSTGSSDYNHYFGLTMTTRFVQQNGGKTVKGEDITYEFSGDDDVWIFIDDVLVGDLGGKHDPVSISINFSNGEITIKNNAGKIINEVDGQLPSIRSKFEEAGVDSKWRDRDNVNAFADDTYHTLKFFYLERGNNDSNLSLKFNLQEIPESMINKLDQVGNPIKDAEFKLYVAENIKDSEENHIGSTISEKYPNPIYEGTTDSDGAFYFLDEETNSPIAFREFYNKYGSEYFILRETDVPDGYRPFKTENQFNDICLHFDPNTGVIESKHYWETGVFAEPNLVASTPLTIHNYDGSMDFNPYDLLDDSNQSIHIFAIALMRIIDNNGNDKWIPVTGNPTDGWNLYDKSENTSENVVEALHDSLKLKDGEDSENVALFEVSTGGVYQGTLKHMPGDITDYYWYQKKVFGEEHATKNAKFTVSYYYSYADTVDDINVGNTTLLQPEDFDREFAVSLYIPDIGNYFVVEKVDKNGEPINGIPFSLYVEDNVEFKDDGTFTTTGDPYRKGVTKTESYDGKSHTDGMFIFRSLKKGTYYLVEENRRGDKYLENPNPVKIIVDDNGVYADAGTADDGISTRLEIGSVLKSVRQFASDDGVDNTIHDIQVKQLTSTDSINWNTWDDAGEAYHFHYEGISETNPKEYKPSGTGKELPEVKEGWSKISVRQCYEHQNDVGEVNNSDKKDIRDKNITGLFSPTLFVKVVNEFEEEVELGDLTVEKIVSGNSGEMDKPFNFEVVLNDSTINGEYGDMLFDGGRATFQLKHGENKTAIGLPTGIDYAVIEAEANQDGYDTTSVNSTGIIAKDGITVTFTNHKDGTTPPIPDPDEPVNPPTDPDEPTDPDTDKPTEPTEPEEPAEPENPKDPETEEPSTPDEGDDSSDWMEIVPIEDDEVPNTSARSNLMVWIGLSIVSFVVIVATLISRKQNRCK